MAYPSAPGNAPKLLAFHIRTIEKPHLLLYQVLEVMRPRRRSDGLSSSCSTTGGGGQRLAHLPAL